MKQTLRSILFLSLMFGFQALPSQNEFSLDGHIPAHSLGGFPSVDIYSSFHSESKDSMFSVVAYNSMLWYNQSELVTIDVLGETSVFTGLPYEVSGMALSSVVAVTMSDPITTSSYRLNGNGVYWGDNFQRILNFTGLTVPQNMRMVGTAKHGGEVALIPPGPFPLQAGLGDFGWYVVDDSLSYLYKRSVSCGIANTNYAAGGGTFLKSGAMLYVGGATMNGTGQKYNVVVGTDSSALNPIKVISLKRANGAHLSLTKVSECSAGVLLGDESQMILVMLDHSLSQVLWAKSFSTIGLVEPPVEGQVGILHGILSKYTVDTVPYYPFYYYRRHWGHYGLDMQTGSLLYAKYIPSFYTTGFADVNVIMPPYVLADGVVREVRYMTDDYHSEWYMNEVDSTGYLGCYSVNLNPVVAPDSVVLTVLSGWTVDNVGAGVLQSSFPSNWPYIYFTNNTLECTCRPQLSITGTPNGPFSYQFSVAGVATTTFQWDFGDGSQFTGSNPSHVYPGPGTYLVTACRDFGCGILCDTLNLTISCAFPVVASFTQSTNLLTTTFTNTGNQSNLQWSFGDGGTSSLTNPTHTYSAPGTYNACLIASDSCSADTVCHAVTATCPLPFVNFTYTTMLQAVFFSGGGSQGSLLWDFGDGGSSTQTSPTHGYAVPGTYNVCLTATNSCGASTVCHSVTVTCPLLPNAVFYSGNYLLTASFNSTGSQGTLIWQFGDGGTSTLANPTHTYAAPGTYNVCLIATNSCGADTVCHPVTVTCPLPNVAFTQSSTLLTATFNSAGSQGTLLWQFGDGGTSTLANPTHAYTAPGTYNVCLIATNSCGADTVCHPVTVTCPLPNVAFTQSSTLLTATFNSAGSQGTLVWQFGDGGTSTLANPTHAYTAPGTYNVCLIATNSCGADTVCHPITVTCPLPSVAFTQSSTLLTATFNSAGSQGTLVWQFGDGGTSTLANPTHAYTAPGTYNVCLIATNSCGADTVCHPVTVTCPLPNVAFTQSSTLLTATFNSAGSQGTLLWQFGDGGTSTLANPTHAYTAPGTYNVCLIATNSCGADTVCHPVTVTCPLPNVAFTQSSSLLTATFNSAGSQGTLLWQFGDGGTSTLANPTHAYTAPGTYNVCLIATNSCGADTVCHPITVTCPLPNVAFTQSSTLLTATFNSAGSQGTLLWQFGDGGTSTLANPTHAYTAPGTYNVCLIATNSCGADTVCHPVTVTCPLPNVAFTQSSTLLTATFNSAGSQGTLLWQFGDGGTSTLANPTHAYTAPGTYNVCLIATNSCGADTVCHPITVTCPLPTVNFVYNSTGLNFQFQNMSSGSSNFSSLWDFGDGATSTQISPTHTYSSIGNYIVCLTVTDTCGTDSLCQNLTSVGRQDADSYQLHIYPQPADEWVVLAWTGILEAISEVTIYGIDGKCLKAWSGNEIEGKSILVDTGNWASGVYFLRLQTLERLLVRRIVLVR